jgi:hypothetical protein
VTILNATNSHAKRTQRRTIIAPTEPRAQLRLCVDSRFTLYYFEQLFAVFKLRTNIELAEHIIAIFDTKSTEANLRAFYRSEWLDIPFQKIDTSVAILATRESSNKLWRIGGEVLGGVNRSKTFRIIVNYLAFVHRLKKPNRAA